jgi:hypothetical protein
MAALKKRSASVDNVGHFYYDWALSRYKWTPEEAKNKQNNIPIQKNDLSNENGEVCITYSRFRVRAGFMSFAYSFMSLNLVPSRL